uniref:PROTEIN I, ELECTRON TRANSPORT n=1 Tax=Myoviridae sp. ctCjb12 TaxID=2826631 RepID=A0A8S5MQB9_9CAUD|nr:MAG TPA: PROTEIN I, ELECTRON TRANSPORT [Myoviridae sp. ctCjb12]
MKIKSTVLHILAAGCGCLGLLYGLGLEGSAQVGGTISDSQFITAMVLILAALALIRLGFSAEAREEQEARRRKRIDRRHARPQEPAYRQNRRDA